jgi:hypothetical protein
MHADFIITESTVGSLFSKAKRTQYTLSTEKEGSFDTFDTYEEAVACAEAFDLEARRDREADFEAQCAAGVEFD